MLRSIEQRLPDLSAPQETPELGREESRTWRVTLGENTWEKHHVEKLLGVATPQISLGSRKNAHGEL